MHVDQTLRDLPQTSNVLSTQASGSRGLGAQLFVALGETIVVDTAVGRSAPEEAMRTDALHNTWCATKPIVAVFLAYLLRTHGLELDTQVGAILPSVPTPASTLSCASLMNHSSGLTRPSAYAAQYMRLSQRRFAAMRAPAELEPTAAYSEYVGSSLMAALIEHLSQGPARASIEDGLLIPLNLERDIVLGASFTEFVDLRNRIGAFVWGLPQTPIFALTDRLFHQGALDRMASGGLTTARGLGLFYQYLGRVLSGREQNGPVSLDTLATMLTHRRGTTPDPVLERRCDFGCGFAVELVDHGYGSYPSSSAFGHSGLFGCSFAMFDPEHELSVSAFVNGADMGTATVDACRTELISSIYQDLGYSPY